MVDKDFLVELVMAAESDPRIGFTGPKTNYFDYSGRKDVISFAGGKLDLRRVKPIILVRTISIKGNMIRYRKLITLKGHVYWQGKI